MGDVRGPCKECAALCPLWKTCHHATAATIAELETELTEWRSGKRSILCWRVRYADGHHLDCSTRSGAFYLKSVALVRGSARIYRVTVGPAKPKGAK